MVNGSTLSRRQLIRELVMLCKQRASGTVFFNLDNGDSARLVLKRGVICWVAYRDLRGEPAIDAIGEIEAARLSFNSLLKMAIGEQILPSTQEIIKGINAQSKAPINQDVPTVTEVVSATTFEDATAADRPFNFDHVRIVLEEESMEYLGPMAKILCADYMKTMPSKLSHAQVRHLISTVVQDINDERKGERFLSQVKRILSIH
jgi:hypothetical protein